MKRVFENVLFMGEREEEILATPPPPQKKTTKNPNKNKN
jgi:hypothetical protein